MSPRIPKSMEVVMDDEIGLLRLRVIKFPMRILRDAREEAVLALKSAGWSVALVEEHFEACADWAIEKRNEVAKERRKARRIEREADREWTRESMRRWREANGLATSAEAAA